MAIVKVAKGGKTLSQALNYIDKEKDFLGKDLSDNKNKALEEMQIIKQLYNKEDGRQYKHYIVSFKPDEVSKETAKKIALEFVKKNFNGYQVAIGTHTDKKHIHCHLVVNSVNFETGQKFHVDKNFLNDLRKSNDLICKNYGLEIVKPKELKLDGELRAGDMKKYQVLKSAFENKKKSYVLNTAIAVKNSLSVAKNKDEFINCMEHLGYKTSWIDTRKHITFTNQEEKKIRLSNLEKTFTDNSFSKEGFENEFKRNIERTIELNSKREITGAEQVIKSRIGEQSTERTFDRISNVIRELEERLREYSVSGRETIEREQREIERINREQQAVREISIEQDKRIERKISRGISL